MTQIDIRALAQLARLDVRDDELAELEKDLPGILAFVDTVQKAEVGSEVVTPALRNVVRADENPHESGLYTEKLLSAAPAREGDRIAVKQVISRKK